MTPEHADQLQELAQTGRLGPFCVWPRPPGWPEDGQIEPMLVDRRTAGRMQAEAEHFFREHQP